MERLIIMDILRKIFGLQPNTSTQPVSSSPTTEAADDVSLEGATAPLDKTKNTERQSAPSPIPNIHIPDDGSTQKLPDLDLKLSSATTEKGIIYGHYTDVGQIRSNNQDAVLSFLSSSSSSEEQPEFGIFIIADGMGGHHDGEKASAVTTRVVAHHISQEVFLPMLSKEDSDANRPTISEVMREAVQQANRKVTELVPDGGTTVTASAIIGDLAYIGHVGDSRAYIIDKDGIEQITRDHSLVQRLIELEQLTPEDALEHPNRNVLYRAIGQNENIDVDAVTRRLMPGSRLLICTDGLWNLVPEDEIRSTTQSSPTPQAACETLVKLANERGGPDNISVVIVKIPE